MNVEATFCFAAARDAIDPVCRMRVARDEARGHLRVYNVDYWFCSPNCAELFAESPESYAPRR